MKNGIALIAVMFLCMCPQGSVHAQSDEKVALDARRQALVLQDRGDYANALFYYEQALVLSPKSLFLYNDIGLMNEFIGRMKEAETSYLKSIQLNPDYLPAYANLGMFYQKQGQYVLAAKYLRERVSRGSPDDVWTIKAQAELMKIYRQVPALDAQRVKEEADEFAEKIVEAREKLKAAAAQSREKDFEAAYSRGIKAFKDRRFLEAVEALQAAVALNPRSNEARLALQRAQYAGDKSSFENEVKKLRSTTKQDIVSQTLDQDPSL